MGVSAARWTARFLLLGGLPCCMTADSGAESNAWFDDRRRAIEDELRTPWTLLTVALEELAGTIVDVDGRAAIEMARRSALRVQHVAEAFLAGDALPDACREAAPVSR